MELQKKDRGPRKRSSPLGLYRPVGLVAWHVGCMSIGASEYDTRALARVMPTRVTLFGSGVTKNVTGRIGPVSEGLDRGVTLSVT